MSRGRYPILTMPQLRRLREWRSMPRRARPSLRAISDMMGISYSTAKRGANGKGYYAQVQS